MVNTCAFLVVNCKLRLIPLRFFQGSESNAGFGYSTAAGAPMAQSAGGVGAGILCKSWQEILGMSLVLTPLYANGLWRLMTEALQSVS